MSDLHPAAVWAEMDLETRRLAARAVYEPGWDDGSGRAELDAAVCEAIRFRPLMVRRLPVEKRVDHLLRSVHPDDELAGTLLIALHLVHRREMLCAFLDDLEMPHEDGVIDGEPEPPGEARVRDAARRLYERFERREVDVYLATLLAMDAEAWRGLDEVLSSPR